MIVLLLKDLNLIEDKKSDISEESDEIPIR